MTTERLCSDLSALGVETGAVVMVHSSLSALGWVAGGAPAVVQAMLGAVGSDGTIVAPSHSDSSEPSRWDAPPLPEAWWPLIRATTTPYDPRTTPTRRMGAIVDCLRSWRGSVRSSHPTVSAVAVGHHAELICGSDHPLEEGTGDRSPLGRIYELGGSVLLLGVAQSRNTSIHLAEWRAEYPSKAEHWVDEGAALMIDGRRSWVTYRDLEGTTDDFERLATDFARETGLERRGRVGNATAVLMPQRALVDYAVDWMNRNRA